MLRIPEYAYNNSKYSSTKISPFNATYQFDLDTNCPTDVQFRSPASELYGQYLTSVHSNLSKQLEQSVVAMKKYYDMKWKSRQPIRKGELVMRNGIDNSTEY
jgi:hypothetical protein